MATRPAPRPRARAADVHRELGDAGVALARAIGRGRGESDDLAGRRFDDDDGVPPVEPLARRRRAVRSRVSNVPDAIANALVVNAGDRRRVVRCGACVRRMPSTEPFYYRPQDRASGQVRLRQVSQPTRGRHHARLSLNLRTGPITIMRVGKRGRDAAGTSREAAAEFLGTFILIVFGVGVVAQTVLSRNANGSFLGHQHRLGPGGDAGRLRVGAASPARISIRR